MPGNGKSPPIGAIGGHVAANVKALRSGRLSLQGLSERLEGLGRHILPIGLSKLETGGRRTDADDVVALSVALGTNPNGLLLPRDRPLDAEVELTPQTRVGAWAAWAWADGRMPLPGPGDEAHGERFARELEFSRNARPAFRASGGMEAVFEVYELADRIEAFLATDDVFIQGALRDRVLRQAREVLFRIEETLADADAAVQLEAAARTLPEPAVRYAQTSQQPGGKRS